MAHVESQFPKSISRGAIGGPVYKTAVADVESSHEYRDILQPIGMSEWDVGFAVRTLSDFALVYRWFRAMRAKGHTFRYWDPMNYKAAAAPLALISGNDFQARMTWTIDSVTESKEIYKLIASTIKVYDNGVEMLSGFSVAANTGIITITSGTGPYTWSGEFDHVARFDTDGMRAVIVDKNPAGELLVEWQSIPIKEVFE